MEIVDTSWAAIVLAEENDYYFLALSPEAGGARKVGERWPVRGTAVEWVINNKKHVVEPDLSCSSQFTNPEFYLEQGIRSVVYLPLIARDRAIGSLIVASRRRRETPVRTALCAARRARGPSCRDR